MSEKSRVIVLEKNNQDDTRTEMWFIEHGNDRYLIRKDFIGDYMLSSHIKYPDGELGRINGNEHYRQLLADGYIFKRKFSVIKEYKIGSYE